MITFITFVLVLGFLVLVHELGHFVSAIKLGVDVEEFGIGFPPKIFSIKRKGIVYSLNLIPLGGFVKIKGESGDEDKNDPRSFANQKAWKKSIILSAGVFMNLVSAFVLLSIGFYLGLPQAIDRNIQDKNITYQGVVIMEVMENSSADKSGLEIGDYIISINDKELDQADDVYDSISSNIADNSENIKLVIKRRGEEKEFDIKPTIMENNSQPIIGIGLIDTGIVNYSFLGSIIHGFNVTIAMIKNIIIAFGELLWNLITGQGLAQELSGPVGVAIISGQVAKMGWIYVLQFAAILSINLGIINILPFPALDGGRLLFVAIEKIRGKKIPPKIEALIHNTGFILLLLLILVVTFRDIGKYGGGFIEMIKNIF